MSAIPVIAIFDVGKTNKKKLPVSPKQKMKTVILVKTWKTFVCPYLIPSVKFSP
jgi:hypothetical protein